MSETVNKRLNVSDVITLPYEANKSWVIPSSSFQSHGIFSQMGTYPTASNIINYSEENLVYKSVLANYYPEFYPSSSLSTSSYFQTNNFNSTLTQNDYAVSGALRLGNGYSTYKWFPTTTSSVIYTLNVPTNLYSNRLLPTTVELEISGGIVYDDGEYNLFYSGSPQSSSIGTVLSQSSYVGNVFYEQGLLVFTIAPKSIYDVIVTPMSNTITVINSTCTTSQDGSITVTTTNGSGNFTYELVGVRPPQSSNQFLLLNPGSYTVKITDNDTGLINTLPATVGNNNSFNIYYATLNKVSTNIITNTTWDKLTEEVYEVVITPPLPVGRTATIVLENIATFNTNYRSPSTYQTRTLGSAPFTVRKNGSIEPSNFFLTGYGTPAMVCDPSNTYLYTQNTYRSQFVTMTAGDAVTITVRNRLLTPTPSPDPLCPSEGYYEFSTGFYSLSIDGNCNLIQWQPFAPAPNPLRFILRLENP